MTITVYHLNILCNDIVVDRLNYGGRDGKKGWGSHELFEMHADIATGCDNQVSQAIKAYLDGHYKAVAILGEGELEDAFRLTNHIETSWTENDGVSVLGGSDRLK